MTTLFGENAHQLFKRPSRLAHFELDLYSVTIDQITSKGCIVVWIVPIPTLTSFVVIGKDPLQPFDV